MKKHQFFVAFMVVACLAFNASAQMGKQKRNWTKVEDSNSLADFYYDPDSIVKREDTLRVLILMDVNISSEKTKSYFYEMILKCSAVGIHKFYQTYRESYGENKLQGDLQINESGMYPNAGIYEDVTGSHISVARVLCLR